MSMTALDEGLPDGATGAHPWRWQARGLFRASKAVPPPAEWPTAATLDGFATPCSTEMGSAEACSTAASVDFMTAESLKAAVGLTVDSSTWAASPHSR